jgi:hypothetical protein
LQPERSSRLLKNAHLLRCAHHTSLRRTKKYASFRMISRALHPSIFEQPVCFDFFNILRGMETPGGSLKP